MRRKHFDNTVAITQLTLTYFSFFLVCFFPKIKCRSTLRISGLIPSAYWCGQAAVDIPFCYLILSCMTVVLFSLHTEAMLTSSNLTAVVRTAEWTSWMLLRFIKPNVLNFNGYLIYLIWNPCLDASFQCDLCGGCCVYRAIFTVRVTLLRTFWLKFCFPHLS